MGILKMGSLRSDLKLDFNGKQIPVVILATPDFFPKEDASREVFIELSGTWKTGVFYCYPDESTHSNWDQPVEWEDGELLYVPTLEESSIVSAVKFLLSSGAIDQTFNECEKPDEVLPLVGEVNDKIKMSMGDKIELKIQENIYNSFLLIKSLGKAKTKADLVKALNRYGNEVLESGRI